MSLFGTLNTAVSGLAAQASYLGTIGDNISNASTTGYKQASAEFETLLSNQSGSTYDSGGVQTRVRYGITDQGTIVGTSSVTDLAISGSGFFVVQSPAGMPALTRAGAFVPNATGNLVNSAGYELMGYDLTNGSSATANGTGGLVPINISSQALTASPSTAGTLTVNLPSNATAVAAGNLPSANAASSTYTGKTSLVAYDSLGNPVTLDVYMSKTGANTWEADVYNQADAAAGGGFPYSSGPLTTQNLTFDGTTGKLTGGSPLSLTVPNGSTLNVDLSQATQLASGFNVASATVNGSSPSTLDHIEIGTDGTVTSVFKNGVQQANYRIPLADVPSPDQLTSLTGNVYEPSLSSGQMTIGAANSGNLGQIDSSSLEQSTVDIATELTAMISAQRSYEANSKVIQTSSDLLSVITNLKT